MVLMLYLIAWAHVNFYNGFDQNPYLKLHGFHAFSVFKRYGKDSIGNGYDIGRFSSG